MTRGPGKEVIGAKPPEAKTCSRHSMEAANLPAY